MRETEDVNRRKELEEQQVRMAHEKEALRLKTEELEKQRIEREKEEAALMKVKEQQLKAAQLAKAKQE